MEQKNKLIQCSQSVELLELEQQEKNTEADIEGAVEVFKMLIEWRDEV